MPGHQREIRVFVSSTFRDMQAERELLIKHVFPELRRHCSERFVTFTEVDLRWGITEEQAAEGRVLPICLDEIERSRPYFIGLLGERYGWINEDLPVEVIEREPWLREHVGQGTSVTELEMLHGVLRNESMHQHAYFYFRDPAYLDRLPPARRRDFECADPHQRLKLERLKERIRSARDQGVCQLLENYPHPDALASAVRDQFKALIDHSYPRDSVPDPLDRETMGHEAFARSKRFACIDRPDQLEALDRFIASDGPPVLVTGESGGGKTVLLAQWAAHWAEAHPADLVFQHFCGATSASTFAKGLVLRMLGELKRRYGLRRDLPSPDDDPDDAMSSWLAMTPRDRRIVLVLDGLDRLRGSGPDRRLEFMPRRFPAHVRVVASSLPGPGLEALRKRGWAEHRLSLPDRNERKLMIAGFLGTYRKTLSDDLVEQVLRAPPAANPLFLRTLLEELRQFGSFRELPERVRHYLEAENPVELFRRVVNRWQSDFGAGQDLVRNALRLLWAAFEGLSEAELLELLGPDGSRPIVEGREPLARQRWRPLFLAMEAHLVPRAGLYTFGHEFLRRGVQEELLPSPDEQQRAHRDLALYFDHQRPVTSRTLVEFPWQLAQLGHWEKVRSWLLMAHWDAWAVHSDTDHSVLMHCHYLATAASIGLRKRRPRGKGALLPAFMQELLGEYRRAADLYLRVLERSVEAGDPVGPDGETLSETVRRVANVLPGIERPASAESILRRMLAVEERAFPSDRSRHSRRLMDLCTVLVIQGNCDEAATLCARVWALDEPRGSATGARVLFLRTAIALLRAESAAPYLGRLQTLLGSPRFSPGNVTRPWSLARFMDGVGPRIREPDRELLAALAAALDNQDPPEKLEEMAAWQEAAPVPLNAAWPEGNDGHRSEAGRPGHDLLTRQDGAESSPGPGTSSST